MFTTSCALFLSSLHLCLCVDLIYYATEGKNPGTFLGDLAADTNLMEDKEDSISFIQLGEDVMDSFHLFRVSKTTGKLYTAQMLDAESLCKRNTECFRTVDVAAQQGETFIQILEIKIIIQDINDHHPKFPVKQVDIKFSEDDRKGRGHLIPSAIDQDVSFLNSQIAYELRKKVKPFSLTISNRVDGTVDLLISLEDNLDREMTDAYDLQVVAKDKGTPAKQAILNVRVSVLDVNDNIPVFPQNLYNVSAINEHYSSMPLVVLSATDSDLGKNGEVSYHFSSQTPENIRSHFELQETTGEIFLCKKFVPGQELKSKLYVKAVDGGTPPLSSVVMVLVNVISQQNNEPIIDINFVSVSTGKIATISEGVRVGSFIAYVKVTDHDVGLNGEVACNIQHEKFQLQDLSPKKYKVTIKQSLDRETETHHDVTIRCQDKGSPPLHRESKFSIQVLDINDVLPTFSKHTFHFWTAENQRSKVLVGYITATDPDLGPGGQLTYSMLNSQEQLLPFHLTDDGFISTTSSLDHELKDVYKFRVLVRDNGTPSLNSTADVVIEVTDVNDNAPYFTFPGVNPFTFEFNYHPRSKNNITMLKASDSDSRENAFLKYEITTGNEKQLFTINRYTGLLSFTRVPSQEDAGFYDLHFAVKDSGRPVRSAETVVSLMLIVSNDTSELHFVDISKSEEAMDVGLLILTVLLAVVASIALVIPITICIIRYNDRRNASRRNQVDPKPCTKCTTEPEPEMEEEIQHPTTGGTAMILQTTTTEVEKKVKKNNTSNVCNLNDVVVIICVPTHLLSIILGWSCGP